MGNTMITLPMIASEFLRLTGPGEATAMFISDVSTDSYALAIRSNGRLVVSEDFNNRLLTMSLNDFAECVLAPLVAAWQLAPRREGDDLGGWHAKEYATVRLP